MFEPCLHYTSCNSLSLSPADHTLTSHICNLAQNNIYVFTHLHIYALREQTFCLWASTVEFRYLFRGFSVKSSSRIGMFESHILFAHFFRKIGIFLRFWSIKKRCKYLAFYRSKSSLAVQKSWRFDEKLSRRLYKVENANYSHC